MAVRTRRRLIARLTGLVLALLAFLRAPFDVGPTQTSEPWWPTPPAPPTASAAVPVESLLTPRPVRVPTAAEPIVYAPAPYRYNGPADLALHPVATDRHSLATLLDERLNMLEDFGESSAGRDVLFLLGAEHQGVGDFSRAADFYEAFLAHPDSADCAEGGEGCAAAAASLENVVLFRRALDQPDVALANADQFNTRFAMRHPRAATRVAFAAAEMDPEGRVARLQRLARRRLPPAEAIQVDVRLGKALWSHDRPAARNAFRRAERRWRRHGGPQMATSPGLDATTWIAELGRTREALAEARFFEARRRGEVSARVSPPAYSGAPTERRVQRWVERTLRPWMRQRLAAIQQTQAALDRVDALGLSRWTVPAAALRGQLHQDLADALAALDVPQSVQSQDDESLVAVVQIREPVHRHLIIPAMEHFRSCMELARETRHYGQHSDRCADGLARYEPRWRRPDELRPRMPRTTDIVRPDE